MLELCFKLALTAAVAIPATNHEAAALLAQLRQAETRTQTRIDLPRTIDPREVERFHAELVAHVENHDAAAVYRLLIGDKAESRLGARVNVTDIVIRLDQIALDFPRETATPAEFLAWFEENIFNTANLAKRAEYHPHLDAAVRNERTPNRNEIIIPGRVLVDIGEARVALRAGVTDLGGGLDLRSSRLNAERIALILDYVMLAQWEETYHHYDWVTYQHTGRSASPALNRWMQTLDQSYSFWPHCELTPAVAGFYDYRFLRTESPVNDRFMARYPFVRRPLARHPSL